MLVAIDAGEWGAARTEAEAGCKLAAQLYPPSSPALGLQLLRLAKLQAHTERLPAAVESWLRALAILRISHGDSARLVQEVRRDLDGAPTLPLTPTLSLTLPLTLTLTRCAEIWTGRRPSCMR